MLGWLDDLVISLVLSPFFPLFSILSPSLYPDVELENMGATSIASTSIIIAAFS